MNDRRAKRIDNRAYRKALRTMKKIGDYTQELPPGMISEVEQRAAAAYRANRDFRNPTAEANLRGMEDFQYGGMNKPVRDTLLNGIARFGGQYGKK